VTLGKIYLVATPIGNLRDITLRALDCLKRADVLACEDTRHSKRLLDAYEITGKKLVSYHQHNEAARSEELVTRAQAGEIVACLTDAGMPSVSDPGLRLVQKAVDQGVAIEVLPGASAVLTGLAGSGLATDSFYFGGFLSQKSGRRERELREALERSATTIHFESPHRLIKTLNALQKLESERSVCVARELTKRFETYHRGTAEEVFREFENKEGAIKGEITFLISGKAALPKREKRQKYPQAKK